MSKTYIHSATALELKSWRFLFAFLRQSKKVTDEMKSIPGLVSVDSRARLMQRRFETKSVWRDRDALGEFMRMESHQEALRRFPEWSGPGSRTASWTADGPELTWAECERKLAEAAPIDLL